MVESDGMLRVDGVGGGADEVRFVVTLNDGDDVFDAESIVAQEIVHRITRAISFERVDLLPDPTVRVGRPVVAGVFAPGEGDVIAAGLDVRDAVVSFREGAMID